MTEGKDVTKGDVSGLDDILNRVSKKPKLSRKREFRARFTAEEYLFLEKVTNSPGKAIKHIVQEVWPEARNHKSKAESLMKREDILDELERRDDINRYRASYKAEDVIEHLWKEATSSGRGSSQLARINALQLLGRHINLFSAEKEKPQEKDAAISFNIVNYAGGETKVEKIVEEAPKAPQKVIEPIPSNQDLNEGFSIEITDYSEVKPSTTK